MPELLWLNEKYIGGKMTVNKLENLRVFITHLDSVCTECNDSISRGDMIGLTVTNEPLCSTCT